MYIIKASGINPYAIGPDNPYYTPKDIQTAYSLPSTGGSGTIAIIDAYSDPKISSDLASFCTQWGLTSANLEIHPMSANVQANYQWGMEISLDVEWSHAIAPNAKILLVEANSASTSDLLSAVSYAASRSDVVAISMSWGASEFSGEQAYDSYFTSNYGAVFFASAGDTGGAVTWPSSSPNVVSVGGTTLTQTATGYTETAWSEGGGGISAYEPMPAYQTSAGIGTQLSTTYRATPDVSYNANPNTGFLVLDTYIYNGWYAVGGTSAGAPQWAAIQALGGTATDTNFYANYKSNYGIDFTDITSGTSGSNSAGQYYDLCTGIGTPIGTTFGAAPSPNFAISVSPSTLTINAGSTGSATVAITPIRGYSQAVTLSSTSSWASFSANPVTPPYSPTQLTITVPSTASAGTTSIVITGTGADGKQQTTTLTIQVTSPNFSLSANPTSLSIRQTSSGTTRITVNAIGGYKGTIALSASGLPTGMTATFSPTSVNAGSSSTMTIRTSRTTPIGTYTITVSGTDTLGNIRTTTIKVTVHL
jgi:subtilase family serine protease